MESIQTNLEKYTNTPHFKERYNQLIDRVLKDQDVQAFLEAHKEELSDTILANSYARLYEFVKEKERIAEHGYSQNPGFEPQLIMNVGYIDIAYQATEDFLRQEEQRLISQRVQTLEMPKDIKETRLSQVEKSLERREVISHLITFINGYTENPNDFQKGIYLYGSYGVGKTYLLGALANELAIKGYHSFLAHFPSLVVEMKAAIGDNSVAEKLDIIKKTPVLILDDIGGESMTPWVRDDILMVILDYRMRQQLPTFFSSNLSFELLEEHLKGTSIEDERKAKRLMERITYLSQDLYLSGTNRRQS